MIISERQGKAEEREQEREKREKEGEKKEGQGREEGRKREAYTNWASGRRKQKDQESKVAFSHSKFKALLSQSNRIFPQVKRKYRTKVLDVRIWATWKQCVK